MNNAGDNSVEMRVNRVFLSESWSIRLLYVHTFPNFINSTASFSSVAVISSSASVSDDSQTCKDLPFFYEVIII